MEDNATNIIFLFWCCLLGGLKKQQPAIDFSNTLLSNGNIYGSIHLVGVSQNLNAIFSSHISTRL